MCNFAYSSFAARRWPSARARAVPSWLRVPFSMGDTLSSTLVSWAASRWNDAALPDAPSKQWERLQNATVRIRVCWLHLMSLLCVGYYGCEWTGDEAQAESGEAFTVTDPVNNLLLCIVADRHDCSARGLGVPHQP